MRRIWISIYECNLFIFNDRYNLRPINEFTFYWSYTLEYIIRKLMEDRKCLYIDFNGESNRSTLINEH